MCLSTQSTKHGQHEHSWTDYWLWSVWFHGSLWSWTHLQWFWWVDDHRGRYILETIVVKPVIAVFHQFCVTKSVINTFYDNIIWNVVSNRRWWSVCLRPPACYLPVEPQKASRSSFNLSPRRQSGGNTEIVSMHASTIIMLQQMYTHVLAIIIILHVCLQQL